MNSKYYYEYPDNLFFDSKINEGIADLYFNKVKPNNNQNSISILSKTKINPFRIDIVIKEGNSFGINMSLIDCDYYRLIDGDTFARSQYIGKYMIQYEFAENTRAWLFEKYLKK